jgi:predicted nicotinamide N-methyase
LPPPFWAFAWAGGQGLARYILDNPDIVRGKTVLDFASGSGFVAIAAKLAGARSVHAVDIDPWAEVAMQLNADINQVSVYTLQRDVIGEPVNADVVLVGDVFYDQSFAKRLIPWFSDLARLKLVPVGDPPIARKGTWSFAPAIKCPSRGHVNIAK